MSQTKSLCLLLEQVALKVATGLYISGEVCTAKERNALHGLLCNAELRKPLEVAFMEFTLFSQPSGGRVLQPESRQVGLAFLGRLCWGRP